jgi:hypothetical protein
MASLSQSVALVGKAVPLAKLKLAKLDAIVVILAVLVDAIEAVVEAEADILDEFVEPVVETVVVLVPDIIVAAIAETAQSTAIPAPYMEPVDLTDILRTPELIKPLKPAPRRLTKAPRSRTGHRKAPAFAMSRIKSFGGLPQFL